MEIHIYIHTYTRAPHIHTFAHISRGEMLVREMYMFISRNMEIDTYIHTLNRATHIHTYIHTLNRATHMHTFAHISRGEMHIR